MIFRGNRTTTPAVRELKKPRRNFGPYRPAYLHNGEDERLRREMEEEHILRFRERTRSL